MKQISKLTRGEIAAFVQNHLEKKGISVILSGGAVVSIYSSDQYVTQDIDLINIYSVTRRKIRDAMQEIEFTEEGRHFRHPVLPFIVEFPPGPLSIGSEPIKKVNEITFSTGKLKLLSPTDCVKDRLAGYYHWGDNQCLVQALLVAQNQNIDLEEVKSWSDSEGNQKLFEDFVIKLISRKEKPST